ncbi:MAG: hypothetical protein V7785_13140 [Bermanella sp.]
MLTGNKIIRIGTIFILSSLMLACGGGVSEEEAYQIPGSDWNELLDNEVGYLYVAGVRDDWSFNRVVTPPSTGLMIPYFDAVSSSDGSVQIVYYNHEGEYLTEDGRDEALYNLKHLVWVPSDHIGLEGEAVHVGTEDPTIITYNHTDRISLSQGVDDKLYLAYRGGIEKACNGGKVLADAMFNVFDGINWTEYQGAVGYVERSAGPLLDGHAGASADIAIDTLGNVHLIYQFSYEGCDATNFAYPDLFYAKKEPNQFLNDGRSDAEIEEQVSGNGYLDGNNFQNNTGSITDIIIDNNDNPVIFYYAQAAIGEKGLYVAFKQDDAWIQEPINTQCSVRDVAASINDQGDMFVAYVADACENGGDTRFSLRFSKKLQFKDDGTQVGDIIITDPVWEDSAIEEGVYVGGTGRHLDMTIDTNNRPALVYYELQAYQGSAKRDLKLATFSDDWQVSRLLLAEEGDIGQYNKVWLGENEKLHVATYSQSQKSIYILIQD